MDHSTLERIYCSRKPAKTVRIQKFLEEISDFSFDFQHISGKHIFVSDFLSCFSSDNIDDEPIPYLTDTSLLHNASYMSQLDSICQINYDTCKGVCTSHSFAVTRTQAKLHKIVIPSLFKTNTASTGPSVMASKRLTALPPLDISQSAPEKRRCGRPPTKRAIEPIAPIPELNEVMSDDLNETLPTLYLVRQCRKQPAPEAPQVLALPEQLPYKNYEMALQQIHTRNLQDNMDLIQRTAPTRPTTHNNIPQVTETIQPVNMDRHFPCLRPLTTAYIKDLQFKTHRDVPHQKVINKIIDQLISKTMHFYNLPFALDTLRKGQRKDAFFSDIIKYIEHNHLPTNIKHQ